MLLRINQIALFILLLIFNFPIICSAQTGACTIEKSNCPPADLTPACANVIVGGVFGAYVNWTPPQFRLSCQSGVGTGYAFYMSFDLPEVQNGCWLYSKVQRTGTGGGRLRLWQSTQTNSNPNPNFTTPSFFLPTPPTNCSMTINNGSGNNLTCNVYIEYPNGSLSPVLSSFTISGTGEYPFTITPPQAGIYRLYFEFLGNGNNTDFVDLLQINALLYGSTCIGDINFVTLTTNYPGNFFPVGITPVNYTATCNSCTPVISETCNFDVVVNGVTASVTNTNAFCGLNNGTATITANSSNLTPAFQYNLNNTGWINFNSPYTINGLSQGINTINIRDYFSNIPGYCQILTPLSTNVGHSPDGINPVISCPLPINVVGCGPGDLNTANSGFPYSSAQSTISLAEFTAIGGSASDNCGIASLKYQDSPSGSNPTIVTRTFTATDASGNFATCNQIITIRDLEPPQLSVLQKDFCVEIISDAVINEPLVDIFGPRPEWYILRSGSTALNLTDFSDNCTPNPDILINWRIDFSDGTSLTGNGQISNFGLDIQFSGNSTTTVTHHITYRITDLSGNETESQIDVIIHPRPEIIKQTS